MNETGSVSSSGTAVVPAASLTNLKMRMSRNTADRPSTAPDSVSNSINSKASMDSKKSKWQPADPQAGAAGYELFGRKVNLDKVAAGPNLNKFTLELTSSPASIKSSPKAEAVTESPSFAAGAEEDRDEVMQSISSDEEDDGSKLFKTEPTDYEPDFESSTPIKAAAASDRDEEENLNLAKGKLDNLEKTAHDLENWLENMVGVLSLILFLVL
jgi:hypothetical protein